jgi:hypothetical protein
MKKEVTPMNTSKSRIFQVSVWGLFAFLCIGLCSCGDSTSNQSPGTNGETSKPTGDDIQINNQATTPASESRENGKVDGIGKRSIGLDVTLQNLAGTDKTGSVSICDACVTDTRVEMQSQFYPIRLQQDQSLTVEISPKGFMDDVTQTITFYLLLKRPDGDWMQREMTYSFKEKDFKNYLLYEKIAMSWHDQAELGGKVQGDIVFPVQRKGLLQNITRDYDIPLDKSILSWLGPKESYVLGIVPVPLSSWGDLEGTWEYRLEVKCDGQKCKSPELTKSDLPKVF